MSKMTLEELKTDRDCISEELKILRNKYRMIAKAMDILQDQWEELNGEIEKLEDSNLNSNSGDNNHDN